MIRLHDRGELREFADRDAIVAHFGLDGLSQGDLSGIAAASDAGWPLHAAIDPCVEEIRGRRVLILEASDAELRQEVRLRTQDI